LDANTPEHVLIASSSSGLPSSEFITDCKRNPARILIGHPFNPPHLVPLVEIVPHPGTGEEYVTAAREFYSKLDKDPVVVKQETPGFIANRLQAAVCAEAYSLISRGVISAEDLG
jgi:3-hydroxyacyl-CoA dehydrogenase